VIRRASTFNTGRLDPIYQDPHERKSRLHLHFGDLADANTVRKMIYKVKPTEIYNLGAQSHVRVSFDIPEYTANITGLGTLRMLEAIKDYQEQTGKKIKFYQASSSEMFGAAHESPLKETTQFHPRSPYGVAKVFGHYVTQNYRESYNAWACSGIFFNHESPRRGFEFVTRKVTRAVARIALGRQDVLAVGNMDVSRDWGFAGDYVHAMWLMLQQDEPDDYVVATGKCHSVRDLLEIAFHHVGINDWRPYVVQDERFFRPADVSLLVGDATKAHAKLGWKPQVDFQRLIEMMVDADLENEKRSLGPAEPEQSGRIS
jgi:GDPmannose 4,6-dehydratase